MDDVLLRFMDPGVWARLARFDTITARDILATTLEQAGVALRGSIEAASSALILGLTRDRAGFAARWRERTCLRVAEEMFMVSWDPIRAAQEVLEASTCDGLDEALRTLEPGAGVVVASAHVGPMAFYVPALGYHLARAGVRPRLVAVVNGPSDPRIHQALRALKKTYGARFHVEVKAPGEELSLARRLLGHLEAGAWVTTQVDVVTGGSADRWYPVGEGRVRLPGVAGAAGLARSTGSCLLPVRAVRSGPRTLGIRVEEPMEPGLPRAGLEAKLAGVLERWIQEEPSAWGMLPTIPVAPGIGAGEPGRG